MELEEKLVPLQEPDKSCIEGIEKEVVRLNKVAMKNLYAGNLQKTKILLSKARMLLESKGFEAFDRTKLGTLLSLTLNNQACFYKSQGKPNVALTYLSKALVEFEMHGSFDTLEHTCTLLNVCAILSGLHKHRNALAYATKAVDLLTAPEGVDKACAGNQTGPKSNASGSPTKSITVMQESPAKVEPPTTENERKIVTIGIAYYNMGVELEYLKNYLDAIEAYEKGMKSLQGNLSSNHPVYQNLLKSYNDVKNKQNQRISYHKTRAKARSLHATKLLYAKNSEIKEVDISISKQIKNENILNTTKVSSLYNTVMNFGLSASRRTTTRAMSAKQKDLPYLFEEKYHSFVQTPYVPPATVKGVNEFIKEMSAESNARLMKAKRKISLNENLGVELNTDLSSVMREGGNQRKLRVAIKRPCTTPYQRRLFFAPRIPQAEQSIRTNTTHLKSMENTWKKFTNFINKKQVAADRSILQSRVSNREDIEPLSAKNKSFL